MLRKTASVLFILIPVLLLVSVLYLTANDPPLSPTRLSQTR